MVKEFFTSIKNLCFASLLAICFVSATAAESAAEQETAKDFSSWRKFTTGKLISETTAAPPGATAYVGLYITLVDKWHTYWVNPGDSGAPIRLDFKNGPEIKVKAVHMPVPTRKVSSSLVSFAYFDEVLFPIEIEIDRKALPGQTAKVAVDAEWLVCDEVCIPAIDTFRLDLPIGNLEEVKPGEHFQLFQETRARLPKVIEDHGLRFVEAEQDMRLEIPMWTAGRQFIDFFPFRGSGVSNEQATARGSNPLVLKLKRSKVPAVGADRIGVLVSRDSESGKIEAWQFGDPGWKFTEQLPESKELMHTLIMLLSAFLGGLILNLMPCVFPVLSIKLLSLLKIADSDRREIRKQNLAYTAGVMLSFALIALVLSGLRSAGHLIGWGFQLQSAIFLTFLCWLFFALALNLIGIFEIDLLSANLGHRWTRLGGAWGSFFTGVLAVVVASPCTAPFMGVALGFGISQPVPILLAIFLTLGLGLAFPYLVITVHPGLIRILPKPGPWMIRLKQLMAIPLLLTVAWLLWVLRQVASPGPVAAVLVGCGVILLFVLMRPPRKSAGLIAAGVLAVLLGYVHNKSSSSTSGESSEVAQGDWKPFSFNLLNELKDQNVFVNMTADWCLTCKVNEKLVFSDPEIQDLLKKKNVVQVKGDWTQRSEEITRFLDRYQRVGVPFYVLFSPRNPEGTVLPEVLTKSSFIEWIESEFP